MKLFALATAVVASILTAPPPAQSRTLAIDVKRSHMSVHVHKQGMFSFLADNHEIDAPVASGSLDESNKVVVVTVDASKMRVLDPQLPTQKRDAVQTNMTGPLVLDVAAHPSIVFHASSIDESDPLRWIVAGTLELHGETHPVTLHVTKVDTSHFKGSATIRQTTFGITPIKIAGGAVSVKDDVDVDFEIFLSQ